MKHRNSSWLGIGLFITLFMDGFMMIIPSTLCLIAAVTISPFRWMTFGMIFAVAATLNNGMTYWVGRLIPVQEIVDRLHWIGIQAMLDRSAEALQAYGPFATFISALLGLPAQMVTLLVGAADAKLFHDYTGMSSSFLIAMIFSFSGHFIKAMAIAGLTRYGWVKLERKFQKELPLQTP